MNYIVLGLLLVIFCLWFLRSQNKKMTKEKRCRACGKSGVMAIIYEDGGVCRQCFLDIVKWPGVLKEL